MSVDKFRGAGILTLLAVVFVRWCTSIHAYSGEAKPPMFGDYEAQRHWMEITYNLPPNEWYFNSTKNDLMYWGLDYPPLTAYHSKLCGHIAAKVNVNFVALEESRGHESYDHKLFMRSTVIIADLLVLVPAVCLYFATLPSLGLQNLPSQTPAELSLVWTFLALIYPGLILIDHGHFQYNGISLGLTVAAVTALMHRKEWVGSVLFVLAISYKQMSLYHSLPFFFYLLGSSLSNGLGRAILRLVGIGLVVLATFGIVWFPFVTSLEQFVQVLHRLFPLARGVFEDKVANVWCAVNVVIKLRNLFSNEGMAKVCLCCTLLAVFPSSCDLLFRPSMQKFVPSLINSALAFFLFSYQVHEKSILLAALPVALYFPSEPLACIWFLTVSTFSMLPLLIKDNLIIPTVALSVFHIVAVSLMVDFSVYWEKKISPEIMETRSLNSISVKNWVLKVLFISSMIGIVVLTFCCVVLSPPKRYPDLYPLLVSVYSCVHFIFFFMYFNYCQFRTVTG